GLLLHHILVLGLLQAAHPAGVGAVHLLLQLLAGEGGLGGVDDDHVVAAVGVGGVGGLALAAEQVGDDDGGVAQGLAGGVHDIPLADNIALMCHKSGHGCILLFSGVPSITKMREIDTPAPSSSKEALYFCPKSGTMPYREQSYL